MILTPLLLWIVIQTSLDENAGRAPSVELDMPSSWYSPPCCLMSFSLLFQSTPGQLAGRCGTSAVLILGAEMFQSTPGQLAGRCMSGREFVQVIEEFQSTPGQLAGRCGL